MVQGIDVARTFENSCNTIGSFTKPASSVLKHPLLVATREGSKGCGVLGGVASVSALSTATIPVKSELPDTVQVKTNGLYGDVESEVQESKEIDDNDLTWAPFYKHFENLERPNESTAMDFEDLNLSRHFDADERLRIITLLREFPGVFSSPGAELECSNVIKHQIKTGLNSPVNEPLRCFAFWQREEISKQITDMMAKGVFTSCRNAEWVANVVLARNTDETLRFCVDDRILSDRTDDDTYSIPLIDDCVNVLKNCHCYARLDLAYGYCQVRKAPESKSKT